MVKQRKLKTVHEQLDSSPTWMQKFYKLRSIYQTSTEVTIVKEFISHISVKKEIDESIKNNDEWIRDQEKKGLNPTFFGYLIGH
jgi:hypothetical protein